MRLERTTTRWMIRWQGNDLTPTCLQGPLDGYATKKECKAFIKKWWGFIAHRKDLRRAPHHWRVPKAIKVTLTARQI